MRRCPTASFQTALLDCGAKLKCCATVSHKLCHTLITTSNDVTLRQIIFAQMRYLKLSPFRPRGLAGYMALAFSLMSIVLTVILVIVVEQRATAHVQESLGHELAELAIQTSDKLDRGMFERYREVSLIARRPRLLDPSLPLAERRAILTDVLESYRYYGWLGLADMDGKVVLSGKGLLEGVDVSKRPWFSDALRGQHVGDVHQALLLEKLLSNSSREPMRFVDVSFPYRDRNGITVGVLGAHLSWIWARDVEASIIAPLERSRHVETIIVSKSGTVLLGPSGLQGKRLPPQVAPASSRSIAPEYAIQAWPDDGNYLVGIAHSQGYGDYPGLGWTVMVRQKLDNAFVPIVRLRRYALWSGVGLALLFSMAGIFVSGWITRPLKHLARNASTIGEGDGQTIGGGSSSYQEVRELADSLNGLVAKLTKRGRELEHVNVTLEKRVDDRTAALAEALERASANEKRIRTIVDTAQNAFLSVDMTGRIVDWNEQACRMFGWTREEAIGQRARMLVPERFIARHDATLRDFARTGTLDMLGQRIERVVVDRDGREIPVEMTVGLVETVRNPFFSVFLHDISLRKRVEMMKNEFVATVSHELRTPLTSMRVSLALLADGAVGTLEPEVRDLVGIAHSHCERLVRLVDDMLDIEKMAAGSVALNRVSQALAPLVHQAIQAMHGFSRERRVAVEYDADADADAGAGVGVVAAVDRDRLLQVLTNLLSNAIKFSPADTRVMVCLAARNGQVRIAVADQGMGIPAGFRDRIFRRFAQAGAGGGSGLGLSICKDIVEQHGGAISYTSIEGQGTTFHVDLPVA